jgi:iron complex transport system permease protein
MLVFLPLTWVLARQLNLFTMGDEIAMGLGVRVGAARLALIVASVALAGAAISVSGAIGFVGLMAPHFTRRLIGPSHEGLLPASALMGGLIVLVSDVAGRNLFAPIIIPVGIVTAIIGVPFFIYLLYSHRDQW